MTDDLRPISVVGASAGTGKTYRLASDFSRHLQCASDINAAQVIATTFTNKAADELRERIRRMLLKDGRWEDAQAVLAGYVGTVNSICGRLVSELVIEAGLSPSVNVIAEERQADVFAIAVESMTNSYAAEIWSVANRLSKDDWRDDVRKIAELARQNNIAPEQLKVFAQQSWSHYQKLLPDYAASGDYAALSDKLRRQLGIAIAEIEQGGDKTKITADALVELKEAHRQLAAPAEMSWKTWAKLGKLKTARASQTAAVPVIDCARAHLFHPDFHDDIRKLIDSVFNCAADSLSLYQNFKADHGLIDFVDQEQIALSILSDPTIQESLSGRFHKLFVDEFQDTSPIQLAVFLELSRLVQTSTWVGDEKQSIFGFRGADPELMQEVVKVLVPMTGGERDSLRTSYRSRPALVHFANEVFASSLPSIGIEPETVRITNIHRTEPTALNQALHVWWLESGNWEEAMSTLAVAIRAVLQDPDRWPVTDRDLDRTRPIIGSDIAILCRTNDRRLALADSLSRIGLTVATDRSGLLNRPECILTISVLRLLVDSYDTLAAAQILRLTCREEQQTIWLSEWLEKGYDCVRQSNEHLVQLSRLATELTGVTPVEAIEVAAATPLVLDAVKRWGKVRQRLLNLEALRGLAVSYEELCLTRRGAATPAGLVTYLYNEISDPLQPANPDKDAVQVLTYHKAKGLEWPLVIILDLDTPPSATPFGASVEGSSDRFDPMQPLAGRSLRYWPWPYGQQKANLDLNDAANRSPQMEHAGERHAGENLRLLYVGMTRPRDYLVLACRATASGAGWLNMLKDAAGNSVLSLPLEEGMRKIVNSKDDIMAFFRTLSAPGNKEERTASVEQEVFSETALPPNGSISISYSSTPSSIGALSLGMIEESKYLGGRLEFSQNSDIRLIGEALHRFLAADDPNDSVEDRLHLAATIAESWGIGALAPEQFLEANDRLRRTLEELYPGAAWMKEWPVAGRIDGQRLKGTIDLLLKIPDGFVIVDHKSFPGPHDQWEQQATGHYPQLAAYAQLVQQATSKSAQYLYIHMPVVGRLLKLTGQIA